MEDKIKISLPGLYQYTDLNLFLLEFMDREPELFRENVVIDSMYGAFPCVWNGGRLLDGTFTPEDVIIATTFLNSKNIKLRYTFTNCFIDEDIVKDTTGNAILNLTKDYQSIKNDVNVGNDVMLAYIRDNYPDFNICVSTTMMLKEPHEIDAYAKDYLVVPDYSINNDFDKLAQIKNPQNIEILLNEECIEDCPTRRHHYETNSLIMLKKDVQPIECEYTNDLNYFTIVKNRRHHVNFDDIVNKYLPLGINKFKIAGRTTTLLNVIEGYVEYLAKPEFADVVRYKILEFVLSKYGM